MTRAFKISGVLLGTVLIALYLLTFCSRTEPNNGSSKSTTPDIKDTLSASQVTYFIENSKGNFGYVSAGLNNYIEVVSELAQKSKFATVDSINQDFNFINGIENLEITHHGIVPSDFTSKLNATDFNVGDVSGNDLNAMFQHVLSKAGKDSISILISDGIYDVGKKKNPIKALKVQSKKTTNRFIKRLEKEKVQTLIIKFSSMFKGTFFFGSKPGQIKIAQERPFYVFIFGSPTLLNKYFSDDYIINELKGYRNQARLIVPDDEPIPYMVTHYEKVGNFDLPKDMPHKITNVESDSRRGGKFQFTFAVNLSTLNMPESYLEGTTSYEANNNFKVVSVESFPSKKIFGAAKINPTHIITVATNSFPVGNLTIHLKNKVPGWIKETNIVDDSNIKGNTNQTFGFKFLMEGITDAYQKTSDKKDLATFSFNLEK